MSTTALARIADATGFDHAKVELVKDTIAKGASDDELMLFLSLAQRSGLDPFSRQIYLIERRQNVDGQWRTSRQPQTGIDGLRLIADRTGNYAPGRAPTYTYDTAGQLHSATAYILKYVRGQWHEVAATAHYEEYVQTKKDGTPTQMWADKPHIMLAKCFDDQTEVLTDCGFQKFSQVTGRILQVVDNGLETTDAQPFVQEYHGDMVILDSDDLNFCVTPNHDMVTTDGKVEAGTMYHMARTRPRWWIPRCVTGSKVFAALTKTAIELAAAYIADGADTIEGFKIEVSRPHKIAFLRANNMAEDEQVRHTAGDIAHTATRTITTKTDKTRFVYRHIARTMIEPLVAPGKVIQTEQILNLTQREARIFVDTLIAFDGHQQGSGVRRFYTSRLDHIEAFELACVVAGYSVSKRRSRTSDIGTKPNYYVTISTRSEIPVVRWNRDYNDFKRGQRRSGLALQPNNESGNVWCVTVPSGVIVVRRNGFSMLCGNCAEALALRRAFPADMSGLYTSDEIRDEPVAVVQHTHRPTLPAAPPSDVRTGEVINADAMPPIKKLIAPPTVEVDPEREAALNTMRLAARRAKKAGADIPLPDKTAVAGMSLDEIRDWGAVYTAAADTAQAAVVGEAVDATVAVA
jgi:phage recombination protein Bet